MTRSFSIVLLASAVGVAAISCASVANAETPSVKIDLRLNWGDSAGQKALAEDLVRRGALPLPLVFIDGQLRAMLDEEAVVENRGNGDASIDIGILQIVERPLYSIKIEFSNGDIRNVRLNYVLLSSVASEAGSGAKKSLRIAKTVERSVPVRRTKEGAIGIDLPADPYAELAKFVSDEKEPLVIGKSLPIKPENAGSNTKSLAVYMKENEIGLHAGGTRSSENRIALYNPKDRRDVAAMSQVYSQIPDTYKPSVNRSWLGATTWLQYFRGQNTEALLLKSIPGGASIFMAGTDEGQKTNSTINAVRGTWNAIFLKHKGYLDCQVDPSSVQPPPRPQMPSTFECRMVKASP